MDHLSRAGRSKVMSAIKSRDTRLELAVRQALWRMRLRGYRVSPRGIPGRPDVYFSRKKIAVFVNGCFWHACDKCYKRPRTNVAFWRAKARANKERDQRTRKQLEDLGVRVIVLWEHTIRKDFAALTRRLAKQIRASKECGL